MKLTQPALVTLFVVTCSLTAIAQQTNGPSPSNPQWHTVACVLPRTFYEQTNSSYREFTRDKALQLRKTLNTTWLLDLPCCPERTPNRQNEIFEESLWFASCFHSGAEKGFRTSRIFHTLVEPMKSGQQCNYDRTGNLITSGPGAGTPDFYSPNAGRNGEARHWEFDVFTWTQLTADEYDSVWTINHGCQSATAYSVDSRHINNVWLYVEQGDTINVNASGSIVLGLNQRRSGPEGARYSSGTKTRSVPLPSAPRGTLLGGVYTGPFKSINEIAINKENLFVIGEGGDFKMPASGYLVFLINDGLLADNKGEFQITFYRKVSH